MLQRQQIVAAVQAQPARAVQMHQNRPVPGVHVANAEAVSFDEAFTE